MTPFCSTASKVEKPTPCEMSQLASSERASLQRESAGYQAAMKRVAVGEGSYEPLTSSRNGRSLVASPVANAGAARHSANPDINAMRTLIGSPPVAGRQSGDPCPQSATDRTGSAALARSLLATSRLSPFERHPYLLDGTPR